MADTKISALPAATVAALANEFAINEAGASKKLTLDLIRQLLFAKGANVAAAATTTLGDGALFHITGTGGPVTDIDFATAWDGRRAVLIFDAAGVVLTHSSTLVLPGGENLITQAGDSCWLVQDAGDTVKIVSYERAIGTELTNPFNATLANLTPAAASTTYLANSSIAIPGSGLRLGTRFVWRMTMTKTAAGTAAKTMLVKLGTLGTTGDATILTFAMPVGTAAIDTGFLEIEVTIRGPLGAACIAQGNLWYRHNLATTGLFNKQADTVLNTSAGFNSATAGLIAGLAFTAGAAEAWTIQQLIAESANL